MVDYPLWILMLFGLPLSGKSTLRKNMHTGLQERGYACQAVSVRSELEDRIKAGGFMMAEMKRSMDEGLLLPVEVPVSLFFNMIMNRQRYDAVITDGIGRRREELERIFGALFKIVPQERVRIDIINLNISWEEAEYRLEERRKEGRLDDDPSIVKKRFHDHLARAIDVDDYLKECAFLRSHNISVDGLQERETYGKVMHSLGMTVS